MASAFIRAREDGPSSDTLYSCHVHNRPYFPFLLADASNNDSIQTVVSCVLGIEANENNWTYQTIPGGITNKLVHVGGLPAPVYACLIRIFGAEGMIDRDIETATFASLAEQGIAPLYHGRFSNGRIEGWLDEMRALEVREFHDAEIRRGIAVEMARLHSKFMLDAELQKAHPMDKPSMWTQLEDWCQQALDAKFRTDRDTSLAESYNLKLFPEDLAWLKRDVVPTDAAVAFCHNDILAANVLYNEETKAIRLIDFEYGGINYVGFDIANHFNEYAGGVRRHFVRSFSIRSLALTRFSHHIYRLLLELFQTTIGDQKRQNNVTF
jgi:ethanolamine kinase